MEWGLFFKIIVQLIIAVVVVFFLSAAIKGIADGMRGKK